MKTLKNLFYMFLVLAVGGFASCSDDDNVDRYVETGQGVYFSADTQTSFLLEENASSISLTLYRNQSEGEFEVAVVPVTEHETLFTVPESVIFADGETEADLTIGVKFVRIEAGVSYPLTLTLADQKNLSQFGYTSVDLTVKYDPWTFVGKGLWRDDLFGEFFGSGYGLSVAEPNLEREVNIYSSDTEEGYYRIEEVYSADYVSAIFGADASSLITSAIEYIYFYILPDNRVYFPLLNDDLQPTGFQFSGETYIASYIDTFFKEGSPDNYGTYDPVKKQITFPANSIAVFSDDGGMLVNSTAKHRIVMPGGISVEPAVTAEFTGVLTDVEYNLLAKFEVEKNEDCSYYKYLLVDGDQSANTELLATIKSAVVKGTMEAERENLEGELSILLPNSGEFTAVFVPFSEDGTIVGDVTAVPFAFTGGLTPADFAVTVTMDDLDETWATVTLTPNMASLNYYWDYLLKEDYEAIVAEHGSIDVYLASVYQSYVDYYVSQGISVTLYDFYSGVCSKGVIEAEDLYNLEYDSDYVIFAFCADLNTGLARSPISVHEFHTLAPAELDADYAAWLGDWVLTSTSDEKGGDPQTFNLNFKLMKSNQAFAMTGWGNNNASDIPLTVIWDASGDSPIIGIPEQYTGEDVDLDGAGTMAGVYFLARFYYDAASSYYCYGGGIYALLGYRTDTGAMLVGNQFDLEGTTYTVSGGNYYAMYGSSIYLFDENPCATGPFTLTKAEASPAKKSTSRLDKATHRMKMRFEATPRVERALYLRALNRVELK